MTHLSVGLRGIRKRGIQWYDPSWSLLYSDFSWFSLVVTSYKTFSFTTSFCHDYPAFTLFRKINRVDHRGEWYIVEKVSVQVRHSGDRGRYAGTVVYCRTMKTVTQGIYMVLDFKNGVDTPSDFVKFFFIFLLQTQ